MNKNVVVIGGFVTALIGVGIAAATTSPIAYGVGEANTQTVGTGIFGTLLALAGSVVSAFKLFTGGNATSITNAVDLLRPVLTGQTTLPQGAVRVAFVILEADAVIRKDTEDYIATQALAKQFLLPVDQAK